MDHNLDSLLNLCLEVEGLLALVSRREDNTPESVYSLLNDKVAQLYIGVSNLCGGTTCDADTDNDLYEEPDKEEPVLVDNTIGTSSQADVTFVADEVEEMPDLTHVEDNIDENNKDADSTESIEEAEKNEPEVVEDTESADSVEVVETDDTHDYDGISAYDAEEDLVRNDIMPHEMTINDRFRFRRELFGNSDADMMDALNVANAMSSVSEIEEYFYNDLCWDADDENVKSFMSIITSRLK